MGIRGIDIQVAIQRAADAEKLQQGQTSQVRAGEAGMREEGETERIRRKESPPKTDKSDQVTISKDRRGVGGWARQREEENEEAGEIDEEGEEKKSSNTGLDILA